jgi:hypothetical protein
MTSQIVSTTIDDEYPIAGQDNSTQGFRDNFNVIKNNFAIAKDEISDLQLNSAKLNASNNFGGENILQANLSETTEQSFSGGTVVSGQNISFANGHFQRFKLNLPAETPSITFNLSDWPETNYARMTVELKGNDTAKIVYWTSENGGDIKVSNNWPNLADSFIVDSSTDPILVEFWTYDGGLTVYANYLGRFEDAP